MVLFWWDCFVLVLFLASHWLFRIKNLFSFVLGKYFVSYKERAAAFQGIPFNFLAAVLASHYQKPPQPLAECL